MHTSHSNCPLYVMQSCHIQSAFHETTDLFWPEQDVAPKDAGKLLALTNSASTLVGFAANLITGALAGSKFGYTAVFGLTIAFYLASCLSWNVGMKGQEIIL